MRLRPLALALSLALATPAAAQTPEAIQRQMDEAAAKFQAGDHAGALALLRTVDGQIELPIVRFNIARCLQELGRAREAVDAFERYLKLDDEPSRQARAREAIAKLESTALGRLAVTCSPADARVAVAGLLGEQACPLHLRRVPVGAYEVRVSASHHAPQVARLTVRAGEEAATHVPLVPSDGTLVVRSRVAGGEVFLGQGDEQVIISETPTEPIALPPGTHVVTVRTPGYEDWTQRVEITPGTPLELEAAPVARPAAPPRVDAAAPPADESELRPLPLALAAGATATAIAGTVFFLRASHHIDSVERADAAYADARTAADAEAAWRDAEDARDDARTSRTLSFVFYGAAAALAGAATWTFLDDGGVGVAPSGDGAVVGWSGRW